MKLIDLIPNGHTLEKVSNKLGLNDVDITTADDIKSVVATMSGKSKAVAEKAERITILLTDWLAGDVVDTPEPEPANNSALENSNGTAIQSNTFNMQFTGLRKVSSMAPTESDLRPVLNVITGGYQSIIDLIKSMDDLQAEVYAHVDDAIEDDIPVSQVTQSHMLQWFRAMAKCAGLSQAKELQESAKKVWKLVTDIQALSDINLVDYLTDYAGMAHDGEALRKRLKLDDKATVDYTQTQVGKRQEAMEVVDKMIARVNTIDLVDVDQLVRECAERLMEVRIEVGCLPKEKRSTKYTQAVQEMAKQANPDVDVKRLPKSDVPVSPTELITECNAVRNKRQALIRDFGQYFGETVVLAQDYQMIHDELMEEYYNRKEKVLAMITCADMADKKSWPDIDDLDNQQVRDGWQQWLAKMDKVSSTPFQYRDIKEYLGKMRIEIVPDTFTAPIPESMAAAEALKAAAARKAQGFEQSCFDSVINDLEYIKAKIAGV